MQTAVDLRIAKELRRVLWVTGSGVRTVGISERAKRSPTGIRGNGDFKVVERSLLF